MSSDPQRKMPYLLADSSDSGDSGDSADLSDLSDLSDPVPGRRFARRKVGKVSLNSTSSQPIAIPGVVRDNSQLTLFAQYTKNAKELNKFEEGRPWENLYPNAKKGGVHVEPVPGFLAELGSIRHTYDVWKAADDDERGYEMGQSELKALVKRQKHLLKQLKQAQKLHKHQRREYKSRSTATSSLFNDFTRSQPPPAPSRLALAGENERTPLLFSAGKKGGARVHPTYDAAKKAVRQPVEEDSSFMGKLCNCLSSCYLN